ncbi:MAG: hypothetical protein LBM68_00650 [Bacteroidales bacterium]|jgi:hypothetical protein|nr:hypothetical protein [Bacteroidales bacterium]
MKKLCTICVALVISLSVAHAQEFGKGTKTLKLGAGLNHWGLPTGLVEFEVGIVDKLGVDGLNLGVGGVAGFNMRHHGAWNESNFVISTQGFAHYMPVDRLDCYAGFIIGARIYNNKYSQNDDLFDSNSGVKPIFSPTIGARYQFSSGFGAYGNFSLDGNMYFTCVGVAFEF